MTNSTNLYNIEKSNQLILILGGLIEREQNTFAYALNNNNTFIMLSSGQCFDNSILTLLNHNIENNDKLFNLHGLKFKKQLDVYWKKNNNKMNFLYNYEAKDTLENFTTMIKEIQFYFKYNKCDNNKCVYIYTTADHIERASCIAFYIMNKFNIEYEMVNINKQGILIKKDKNDFNIKFTDIVGMFSKIRASLYSRDILLFENFLDGFNKLRGDPRYKIRIENLINSKSLIY